MGRISVMGAGAVGCRFGCWRAPDTTWCYLGRPHHIEAVERQGLRLETQTFDEHIAMDLRHLRNFVAVAEAGSLAVAAGKKLDTARSR